jgi:phosphoglycolate phosphatase
MLEKLMSSIVLPDSKIENIEMVIFDKDGTLIDVHYYWCSMIEFRANFIVQTIDVENKIKLHDELVDNMGVDLKLMKMKPEGPVGIRPRGYIVEVVLSIVKKYDGKYTKLMVEDAFNKVDELSKAKFNEIIKILPGVDGVIRDLKNHNIRMSIATTDYSHRAILAMESLNIDNYFTDIVGSDMVSQPKPSPDLVNYILKNNNLSKGSVVVIGDSMSDLNMAKNSQCNFIGVKSGLYTDKFIKESVNMIESLEKLTLEY